MTALKQAYWITALAGSAVFAIIFVMTFAGAGDSDMAEDGTDFEADDGGVGFQFFTFKGIVSFFTIFGWTGIICIDSGASTIITLLISTIAGIIMMFLTGALFYYMNKLVQSGTLKINKSVGLIGEVYLPIGAKRSSIGKIQLKVQGSLRELEAITDNKDDLATASIVKVKEVVSAELLLVEKLTK